MDIKQIGKHFMKFEELLDETGRIAWNEEMSILGDYDIMKEHCWVKAEP